VDKLCKYLLVFNATIEVNVVQLKKRPRGININSLVFLLYWW